MSESELGSAAGSGSAMRASHTTDAGAYLDRVDTFLGRRPVEHSVLLSTAAGRAQAQVPDDLALWLWVEDGAEVVAAAQHTPPFGAYLSTAPASAVRLIAARLFELRPELPGVGGLLAEASEFVAAWSDLGGSASRVWRQNGMYAADSVTPPDGVPGFMRPAVDADRDLLATWAGRFGVETGAPMDPGDMVGPRIAAGLLFVWEVDGAVVSMAAVTAAQAGVSRVQLVYTPLEHRRHGYASACVAALTARELSVSGRTCMLYTDLDNPTSNSIYQAIGYRRIGDAVDYRFTG